MTSHPKDATQELIDTIAESRHISHHIHLPFQAGSDRVLREMNRGYSREPLSRAGAGDPQEKSGRILDLGRHCRLSGETYAEFQETLSLIEAVGFTSLYTFIYSARRGTRGGHAGSCPPRGKSQVDGRASAHAGTHCGGAVRGNGRKDGARPRRGTGEVRKFERPDRRECNDRISRRRRIDRDIPGRPGNGSGDLDF